MQPIIVMRLLGVGSSRLTAGGTNLSCHCLQTVAEEEGATRWRN